MRRDHHGTHRIRKMSSSRGGPLVIDRNYLRLVYANVYGYQVTSSRRRGTLAREATILRKHALSPSPSDV